MHVCKTDISGNFQEKGSAQVKSAICLYVITVVAAMMEPAVAAQDNEQRRISETIDRRASSGEFMGTVLVSRGATILLDKGYGSANLEWKIPNLPETRFRLASLTKQFTAAGILLLEEQGKLRVEDRIGPRYFTRLVVWG